VKFIAVVLFSLVFLSFIPLSFGQQGPVTVFSQAEWCHISIGGVAVESLRWQLFDSDVQVTFYAFNDSSLSYDQFIITANASFSDPLGKFDVFWTGEITVEGRIVFAFSSIYGQLSTIVSPFPGEVPHWGRPKMTYTKKVITTEGEIYDVVGGETHVASFEWSFMTLTVNETGGTNQTLPQLVVYNPDGSKFDMKVLTTTFVPLVEYYDLVGWMMDSMGANYVKWIVYSGDTFQIRLNQGFEPKPLPFFIVYPESLTVHPGDTVTVQFSLPSGITNYTASWNDPSFNEYIKMNGEPTFNAQTAQYNVTFKFLESAENHRFTIEVTAQKQGTTYRGSASITVEPQAWKNMVVPIVAFVIVIIVISVIGWRLKEYRHTPPLPNQALRSE